MAQQPETEKNASGIAHAAKRKWGYDAEQVDAFLERAHMLYEGEGAQLTSMIFRTSPSNWSRAAM